MNPEYDSVSVSSWFFLELILSFYNILALCINALFQNESR